MLRRLLFGMLALLLVAAAAGAWWLSRNLDGLARRAIQHYGSAMTQASVTLDGLQLSPTDGLGSIQNLRIGNPKGFQTPYALQVARIELQVDVRSLTEPVLRIRQITIEAPDVTYEKGSAGLTNFDALLRNISDYIGTSQPTDGKPQSGRKLIVEQLTIRSAKAQASTALLQGKTIAVKLPDIQLKDIGKAEGGVTPGELGGIITNALRQRLSAAISFERLLQSGGEVLDKAGAALKGLFGGK